MYRGMQQCSRRFACGLSRIETRIRFLLKIPIIHSGNLCKCVDVSPVIADMIDKLINNPAYYSPVFARDYIHTAPNWNISTFPKAFKVIYSNKAEHGEVCWFASEVSRTILNSSSVLHIDTKLLSSSCLKSEIQTLHCSGYISIS